MSILEFDFMRRALVAALVVGAAAPAIGVFLVQRRLSLMGDGIGHVAFTGVSAGLLLGTSPLVSGLLAACLGAGAIELLRGRGRTAGDVALALIFYGGIAGGALLAFRAGAASNALGYLFGSVLTVSSAELLLIAAVAAAVVAAVVALRDRLFAVGYDEEVAQVSGLPVTTLNLVIAAGSALMVGVAMRVVGLLLVSAMLVLPVAAVQRLTSSFRGTVAGACALGAVLSTGGLVLAFYANFSPGATIVLCAIAAFIVVAAASSLVGRRAAP